MKPNPPAPARPGDPNWKAILAELRHHQRWGRRVARSLGLDPDSPRAVIIREILLARIFSSAVHKNRRPGELLKELQQALKAVPADTGAARQKRAGERKDLKQHLDQLYGP
ncbi:MAG: hypothetical protein GWO16_06915, partial [Gammaproteobacteria bacterium]|nr:hypothetical protein [Gammaproteobacteria bacterium]